MVRRICGSLVLCVAFIVIIGSGVSALTLEERLDLTIEIGSHVTLDLLEEDIEIMVNKPWGNGEVMETSTQLFLRTNTDVELSWESTEIKDQDTGRALPLGIPEKQRNQSSLLANTYMDQPFGLTAILASRDGAYQTADARGAQNSQVEVGSVKGEGETIRSENAQKFGPGDHDFDIILRYYWSEDGTWSDIVAGKYTGSIVYTVSAIDE